MKWGLVGASTIASQHMIGAIRAQKGNDVVSVLSSSNERGQEYAAKHNIVSSTTNLDEFLGAEIDAVYISSTNEKHLPQAMAAINAGKHVVCEKPLAMNVQDAIEIVDAANAAGIVFATNHHLRNGGSHLKIKELIVGGKIGDVLSIRIFHAVYLPDFLQGWRINDPAAGGGVILDIVVHDADTVRFYLEEDPQSVVAIKHCGEMGRGVEDSVMSVWKLPSGVMVQTHESFTHSHAGTGIEIHGTKGSIFAHNIMTQQPVGKIELRDERGVQNIGFEDHSLYVRSMGMFIDAVKGNGSPSATGMDGIKSLAVAIAVKESAQTGMHVHVDYGGV